MWSVTSPKTGTGRRWNSRTTAVDVSDTGLRRVRYRSDTGQIQVRYGSDTGQVLVWFWSDSGQIQIREGQFSRQTGQGSGRYRSASRCLVNAAEAVTLGSSADCCRSLNRLKDVCENKQLTCYLCLK